ncbi:uncharacterized protein ASPGLDRAFT_43206 [Aspergillus glaucus CBS 516.65]|uniref:Uncharacterized protein n=1 Tax=Aspergillus glaucus CBS 516.65 TaxID=1160497 RepID=A0A1L9VVZ8_ASPGL|nr:hypothetical protein ASPGLDRAFT_43206 [Aspergillus glaucus CBS 516.65]OJJ88093.1 hypothetical protein ASPGLDRAFT_43206 [Aspergillus glaucus CBS 516.65]
MTRKPTAAKSDFQLLSMLLFNVLSPTFARVIVNRLLKSRARSCLPNCISPFSFRRALLQSTEPCDMPSLEVNKMRPSRISLHTVAISASLKSTIPVKPPSGIARCTYS